MRRVLVTGANSYIGTSVEKYLSQWTDQYQVDTVDMIDGTWRQKDFHGYDVVFHVAGIAHSDTGMVSKERQALYYKVNRDLTIETAQKAKEEGVGQFIFMSSAIVYGDSAPIGKAKVITRETPVAPANFYGDSKVQAENGLRDLESPSFRIVILRPPMIYGLGCKGNFKILEKFAQKLPAFPKVANRRSMLYVENLVEFVRLMIENHETGTFWPQNAEYSNTSEMVRMMAAAKGRKIMLLHGMEWILKLFSPVIPAVNKAFGNFCYEQSMSLYQEKYQLYSLESSINMCNKTGA